MLQPQTRLTLAIDYSRWRLSRVMWRRIFGNLCKILDHPVTCGSAQAEHVVVIRIIRADPWIRYSYNPRSPRQLEIRYRNVSQWHPHVASTAHRACDDIKPSVISKHYTKVRLFADINSNLHYLNMFPFPVTTFSFSLLVFIYLFRYIRLTTLVLLWHIDFIIRIFIGVIRLPIISCMHFIMLRKSIC